MEDVIDRGYIEKKGIRTGDPTEIIFKKGGAALAHYIEFLGSALAFNFTDAKGYRYRQAIDTGNVKELNKLMRVPAEKEL